MNHVVKPTNAKGFTIIELLLAMSFISILLLAIALTIVQIANIYNRGIVAKEVNQTSRKLTNELETAMSSSSSFSVVEADNHYVNRAWGGRLCLGQYSYIWNYGSALNPTRLNANRNRYDPARPVNAAANSYRTGTTTRYEIGLVKIADSAGTYCTPRTNGSYPDVDPSRAIELLRSGDHSLLLHHVLVTDSVSATDALSAQKLYKITFILGTSDMAAVTGTGATTTCIAPGRPGADPNYCQIQKFTIVLRVVSGVN
jgi:competence protein ComGC